MDVAVEERGELRTLRAEELKKVDMLQGEMEEIGRERNELVAERERLQMEAAERDGYLRERDVVVKEGKALELEKALREISRLETDAKFLRENKEHCLQEWNSAIEGRSVLVSERDTARLDRDTARLEREDLATEKDRLIKQRDSAIQKRDRVLKELTAAIRNLRDEVDAQAKGTARIMQDADAQKKKLTAERDTLRRENDEFLRGRTSFIAERDTLRKERDALTKARDLLRQDMKRLALAATGAEVIGRGVATGMGDFPQRTFALAAEGEETSTAEAIEKSGSESMSGAGTLPQEKSMTREDSAGAEAEPIVAEILSSASKAVDVRHGNVMPDPVEVASSQDLVEHAEDNAKEYNDGQNISSYPSPKKVTISFKTLLAAHKLPFKDLMPGWLKMVEKTLYASRAFKRWRTSPSRYEEDIARVAYKKSPTMRVGVMYWVAGLVMRRVHHISLENLVSKYQLDQRNLVCLDSQMTYACKAEREMILEARQLRDPTFIQATEAKIKAQREVASRSKRAARRASSSQRSGSQITSSSSTPQEPLDPPNIPRKRKSRTSSSSLLLTTAHESNNYEPLPEDVPHRTPRSALKRQKICTDPVEEYRAWTDAVASYIVRPRSELRDYSSEM
ncbi:uncharacterized protein STEHIDRAFT_126474 [Stereum hirsutum FP-91666 SS1]|uniref:Uncharacterized protein n=1 Tax=Stereum hirsutum (strain FP-91666) TaxID=721885 RepID=R7RYQ2_STEHR|nr:uncharacterized protein STEHIDRAFT_126474 [Stereum hirsutum FP-91666 SS1]EIM79462.1 hypothetical protein STEHIDRAFT_126474 [Stereum hirsutum FP-91666 SS1]